MWIYFNNNIQNQTDSLKSKREKTLEFQVINNYLWKIENHKLVKNKKVNEDGKNKSVKIFFSKLQNKIRYYNKDYLSLGNSILYYGIL